MLFLRWSLFIHRRNHPSLTWNKVEFGIYTLLLGTKNSVLFNNSINIAEPSVVWLWRFLKLLQNPGPTSIFFHLMLKVNWQILSPIEQHLEAAQDRWKLKKMDFAPIINWVHPNVKTGHPSVQIVFSLKRTKHSVWHVQLHRSLTFFRLTSYRFWLHL